MWWTQQPVGRALVILMAIGLSACDGSTQQSNQPDKVVSAQEHARSEPAPTIDGQRIFETRCATCHGAGAKDAPAIGQPGAWESRSDLWMAVLSEHVKNGYLEMPARAGMSELTDGDIEAATEYLLLQTYPERAAD